MTGPRPMVTIDGTLFDTLLRELGRRGRGERESGAFLLAPRARDSDPLITTITAVAYYDDLDPTSLTGAIAFSADGYAALSKVCRDTGTRVIADIHTHPGRYVRQSRIDASHPMVAIVGHIAIIAPNFATGAITAEDLGVHVFQGDRQWTSHYGTDNSLVLEIHRAGVLRQNIDRIRHTIGWLRRPRPKK